jgi:hypothetical protein
MIVKQVPLLDIMHDIRVQWQVDIFGPGLLTRRPVI